ncbi:hypothetical protein, partial [Gardnerella greenwoodii]|uniref:hypothetical protein n=1 Tax=Gardnerella greenwoodii TaxID=2914925 RepID=UPI0023DBFFB6
IIPTLLFFVILQTWARRLANGAQYIPTHSKRERVFSHLERRARVNPPNVRKTYGKCGQNLPKRQQMPRKIYGICSQNLLKRQQTPGKYTAFVVGNSHKNPRNIAFAAWW